FCRRELARMQLCPSGFVTVTLTVAGTPLGGVTAVMVFPSMNETLDAKFWPKLTVAPLMKFAPLMVTVVPPALGPLFGDTVATEVTVGAAAVNVNPFARVPLWLSVLVTVTFAGPTE